MTDHSDNFKAGGIPVFLIVTVLLSIVASRSELLSSFRAARGSGLGTTALFIGAVFSTLASCTLYFTAAWAYGVVCTIVCYVFALVATSPESLQSFGKPLLAIQSLWLAVLLGIPEPLGIGVIETVTQKCNNFYGSQAEKMCKSGWLAFNEIVAMGLISVVFLSQLLLVAKAIEAHRSPQMDGSPARVSGGGSAPHYQDLQSQLHNA
uniref:Uncharacterized protein n=1 Tax=Neobodo designis TaxID=312471 RepID=A0A7S1MTI8_NEODS|mmetsp:Transcript_45513/g.140324  ORF Transcript_45513/g.140324 Transcript_45513/m.140324 type:complete len:207 (+) Transcript_45513:36-656(+)